MEWNDETIAQLTALWNEGLSATEIGRRMSISKNAVVGKAHRINLPPRPSPIGRNTGAQPRKPPAPRRVTADTLPPLASDAAPAAPVPPAPAAPVAAAAQPLPPPVPMPAKRIDVQALRTIFRARPTAKCQWPTSNGKPWTFCHADTAAGRSYCAEHSSLAYVKFKAFLAIEPKDLRMEAEDMRLDGAKTTPLTDLLAEVNRRRNARGQSEFFLPGMPEKRPQFGAAHA